MTFSHLSTYKIGLRVQSPTMLKEAIRELGSRLNMQVLEGKIKDYYSNKVRCDIGLEGIGLQYGIGFTADKDGNVEVIGDRSMQARFGEIAETAKNFINAFQVAKKAKQENPFTTTKITIKEKRAILEVALP